MIPPCTASKDGRHNFVPNGICLNMCGLHQGELRQKAREEREPYKLPTERPKEKGLLTEIKDYFGEEISWGFLLKIKKNIGEQRLREIFAAAIKDKPKIPIRQFLGDYKQAIKKT